ncbi:MAG TPA: adenylosuccinate lyase [Candidatus Krumholzibacteria bacterium]
MTELPDSAIIEVRDLVKVYGDDTRAVDGISFGVARGELFGFLGPNGAGKTTTIRILATLLQPTEGTARVAGFDVTTHPGEVRKRLGLAQQAPALDAFSTGRETLELAGILQRMPLAEVRRRADEHRRTPMMGRTHGVHAEPMTFGLKLALWYAELQRDRGRVERARAGVLVGKISGAVGTFAHLPPSIEARICEQLGLEPAPVSSQVIQRDRYAELMSALAITAASLEKFALEIRGLQKTEIGEVEEPFAKGQKGSSAMPHKRNPVGCEQITGLARVVRGNALVALENIALWHERDISHSSAERVVVPDSFLALDHALQRMTRIVAGMRVDSDRMRMNLDMTKGLVFSGHLLLELTAKGMQREDAYRIVQSRAMEAWREGGDFREAMSTDAEVLAVVDRETVLAVFELDRHLGHIDAIFDRVFGNED